MMDMELFSILSHISCHSNFYTKKFYQTLFYNPRMILNIQSRACGLYAIYFPIIIFPYDLRRRIFLMMISTNNSIYMSRRGEMIQQLAHGEKAFSVSNFNTKTTIHKAASWARVTKRFQRAIALP